MKPCDARRERAGLGHVGKQQGKMARGFTGLFGIPKVTYARQFLHKKPFPISPLIFESRPRQPAALPRAQPPQDPDERAKLEDAVADARSHHAASIRVGELAAVLSAIVTQPSCVQDRPCWR
jgi:hypothetical protein